MHGCHSGAVVRTQHSRVNTGYIWPPPTSQIDHFQQGYSGRSSFLSSSSFLFALLSLFLSSFSFILSSFSFTFLSFLSVLLPLSPSLPLHPLSLLMAPAPPALQAVQLPVCSAPAERALHLPDMRGLGALRVAFSAGTGDVSKEGTMKAQ